MRQTLTPWALLRSLLRNRNQEQAQHLPIRVSLHENVPEGSAAVFVGNHSRLPGGIQRVARNPARTAQAFLCRVEVPERSDIRLRAPRCSGPPDIGNVEDQ